MVASDAWKLGGRGLLAAAHGGEKEKASVDEVVEYLLLPETDVDMRAEDLCTALHYACCYGGTDYPAIAKLLIARKADVNARDCAGRTPLHYAASQARLEQVGLLLAAGAQVDARNCYGSTPLHLACVSGAREAAEALRCAGADFDATNNGGWTPLHYALRGGEGFNDAATVEWLMQRGAQRTPQPTTSARAHVYPHPAALSPTGHSMFQG